MGIRVDGLDCTRKSVNSQYPSKIAPETAYIRGLMEPKSRTTEA
jgi:hypothetical protein